MDCFNVSFVVAHMLVDPILEHADWHGASNFSPQNISWLISIKIKTGT
jgi:hypothetical protein